MSVKDADGQNLQNHTIASAASTNATVVKASPGRLLAAMISNFSGASKFVKFYDKATAPVVGTDIPVFFIAIGTLGSAGPAATVHGYKFVNGISYAITGLAPITDTTAVALNDVVGKLSYV